MKIQDWHILNCGVCGEEHWHNPFSSEVICVYCEDWANELLVRFTIQ